MSDERHSVASRSALRCGAVSFSMGGVKQGPTIRRVSGRIVYNTYLYFKYVLYLYFQLGGGGWPSTCVTVYVYIPPLAAQLRPHQRQAGPQRPRQRSRRRPPSRHHEDGA